VVAGKDNRKARPKLLHPIDHKQHSILARKRTYMVGMDIGEAELLSGFAISQDEI
jgi:hypothetical protein